MPRCPRVSWRGLWVGAGRTCRGPADLASDSVEGPAGRLVSVAADAVVNCAGVTGGDPVRLAEVNAHGPAVLCAAPARACPPVRLVHLGPAAEYGPSTVRVPVSESAAACPATVYGATKLAGTVAVSASELDAVVLRIGNPVRAGALVSGLPGRATALLQGTAGGEAEAVTAKEGAGTGMDLCMLTYYGGRERNLAELGELAGRPGLTGRADLTVRAASSRAGARTPKARRRSR